MGLYKELREIWNKSANSELMKQRLIEWRKEQSTTRIERPTRLDRARSLGYKAKPGFIIVRQRLKRGGRQRPKIRAGRRSKHMRRRKVLAMSYQWVAEQRAARNHPNCEVLNSYFVAKDGKYYWYEIILVDKENPSIKADERISWIVSSKNRGRAFRGLTSAARKSRGLRNKGKGAEKLRPSRAADYRRKIRR